MLGTRWRGKSSVRSRLRRPSLRRISIVLAALLATAFARADDDPFEEAREQFLVAYAALEPGVLAPAQPDDNLLRSYPLYPYLQAARIERALSEAAGGWAPADEQAGRFLEFYDVEPVGRDLRRAWLRSLARCEQWRTFVEQYQSGVADPTLRCQFLGARIAVQQTSELAPAIIEQWLTAQQLPLECEPVFQWSRARGILTDELIEQRVRLLLDNGQAAFVRIIAARLPEQRAAPLLQWADLIEGPESSIDALIATPETEVEPAALLDGWTRLAGRNPDAALERYEALVASRGLDPEQASRYALALALGLAWDRRPEALKFFARVTAEGLDDYALTWQARASLWAADWERVERSITAMSGSQREEARWRYWGARAAERRGKRRLARQLYASVLTDDNYYSALAAARLGRAVEPRAEPLPMNSARLLEIESQTPFVRARELLLCRLRSRAIGEWLFGFEMLTDEGRMQAIHLAARWGWYDVAVAAATRQKVFNDYELLYPQPYDDEVRAAAKLSELELSLIYGVIRQESLFHADAASPTGALGLMQLLPETAQRTARRLDQPRLLDADLYDPAVNIRLGAVQLRSLVDRFDGQTVVALAGYNAGPNAAERWLPEEPIAADIWIENIPYNETREYVQRVLWHSLVFAWLRSGKAQSSKSWVGRIARK